MKENIIVEKIKQYLSTVDDCFFYKQFGGSFSVAGIPDIIVCYKGRFIAFEVKNENGKVSVLQVVIIKKILKAGGIAVVVRSLAEVKDIIEALR